MSALELPYWDSYLFQSVALVRSETFFRAEDLFVLRAVANPPFFVMVRVGNTRNTTVTGPSGDSSTTGSAQFSKIPGKPNSALTPPSSFGKKEGMGCGSSGACPFGEPAGFLEGSG